MRMDELEWRALAQEVIDRLDTFDLDDDRQASLKEALLNALDLPVGSARAAIRRILSSDASLREWVAAKMFILRGAGTSRGDEPRDPEWGTGGGGGFAGSQQPLEDVLDGAAFDDLLLGVDPAAYQDDLPAQPPPPPSAAAPAEPVQSAARAEAPPGEEAAKMNKRFWRFDLSGKAVQEGLAVGETCTLLLSVSDSNFGAIAARILDPSYEKAAPDQDILHLTVELASMDFTISERAQSLDVQRGGLSLEPAAFEITPLHEGPSTLTATVHLNRNFVADLVLTVPVGEPGAWPLPLEVVGRPPQSLVSAAPKDVLLVLRPQDQGYWLMAIGATQDDMRLRLSEQELALAGDRVKRALLQVIKSVDENRERVFQTQIEIPPPSADKALKVLATAGADLFQSIFEHDGADDKLRRLGQWLRDESVKQGQRLTVEIAADKAPIPWSLLYLGDASDGAELDWNHFLGASHIVEQTPRSEFSRAPEPRIASDPRLAVSLNLNPTIDGQFSFTLVAEHDERWAEIADQSPNLSLVRRTTRQDVVSALLAPETDDQILYFYCHARSSGPNGDPLDAGIDMGHPDIVTIADLRRNDHSATQLAGHPLVFINACESADLDPRFYTGLVPYFLGKGARGVIGTECKIPARFAISFAEEFFNQFLGGRTAGEAMIAARRHFLSKRNPLGLAYAMHCDDKTQIDPSLLS